MIAKTSTRQRDLVQPIAEEADRLGQPVGREARVEREADVWMAADPRAKAERLGQARAGAAAEHDGPLKADSRWPPQPARPEPRLTPALRILLAAHEAWRR